VARLLPPGEKEHQDSKPRGENGPMHPAISGCHMRWRWRPFERGESGRAQKPEQPKGYSFGSIYPLPASTYGKHMYEQFPSAVYDAAFGSMPLWRGPEDATANRQFHSQTILDLRPRVIPR
jgi:hypothetical protein